jgi:hypothetical protein
MLEKHFQRQVEQLAAFYGWKTFHAPDNRPGRNGRVQSITPGWPDLFMVRDEEAIAAELKAEKGRVQPHQVEWLQALEACGIETFVWRPSDFDELHGRLARGRHRQPADYANEEAA